MLPDRGDPTPVEAIAPVDPSIERNARTVPAGPNVEVDARPDTKVKDQTPQALIGTVRNAAGGGAERNGVRQNAVELRKTLRATARAAFLQLREIGLFPHASSPEALKERYASLWQLAQLPENFETFKANLHRASGKTNRLMGGLPFREDELTFWRLRLELLSALNYLNVLERRHRPQDGEVDLRDIHALANLEGPYKIENIATVRQDGLLALHAFLRPEEDCPRPGAPPAAHRRPPPPPVPRKRAASSSRETSPASSESSSSEQTARKMASNSRAAARNQDQAPVVPRQGQGPANAERISSPPGAARSRPANKAPTSAGYTEPARAQALGRGPAPAVEVVEPPAPTSNPHTAINGLFPPQQEPIEAQRQLAPPRALRERLDPSMPPPTNTSTSRVTASPAGTDVSTEDKPKVPGYLIEQLLCLYVGNIPASATTADIRHFLQTVDGPSTPRFVAMTGRIPSAGGDANTHYIRVYYCTPDEAARVLRAVPQQSLQGARLSTTLIKHRGNVLAVYWPEVESWARDWLQQGADPDDLPAARLQSQTAPQASASQTQTRSSNAGQRVYDRDTTGSTTEEPTELASSSTRPPLFAPRGVMTERAQYVEHRGTLSVAESTTAADSQLATATTRRDQRSVDSPKREESDGLAARLAQPIPSANLGTSRESGPGRSAADRSGEQDPSSDVKVEDFAGRGMSAAESNASLASRLSLNQQQQHLPESLKDDRAQPELGTAQGTTAGSAGAAARLQSAASPQRNKASQQPRDQQGVRPITQRLDSGDRGRLQERDDHDQTPRDSLIERVSAVGRDPSVVIPLRRSLSLEDRQEELARRIKRERLANPDLRLRLAK